MPEPRTITAAEAIREAQDVALATDAAVCVIGEGVADPKGVFGTTVGLVNSHGPSRVIEMPLAENAFTGMAIGAAMMGQRPIVVHQRVEFSLLAMEQMVNSAAKLHYVSGGAHRVPLVIRLVVGRGWGQGPQHSQSLEAMFATVPGLKVIAPALPADAKGMLLSAIADDNPVIVLEHRWIHYTEGAVDVGWAAEPLDGPRRLRAGDDVTVVAVSYMTLEAMQAVDTLAAEGIGVDLFDLRVIRPLNLDAVAESVRRTGRLVTVDIGNRAFGVGAEIAQRITEACFDDLRAAPMRIGLLDHPTPSSRSLAAAFYPRAEHIAEAAGGLAGLDASAAGRVRDALAKAREGVPLDVPHPSFRGPF